MVEKLTSDEIDLPSNLDVLIHFPDLGTPKDGVIYIANAIQYDVSAVGRSPKEAVRDLLRLVKQHCSEAKKMGIHPLCMTSQYYMAAFFMGKPMPEEFLQEFSADVSVRMTSEVAGRWEPPVFSSLDVRDVSYIQEESGTFNIKELVKREKVLR